MCIKDLNRHGYEPAWIMRGLNTKCQLENKQLENVYFLSLQKFKSPVCECTCHGKNWQNINLVRQPSSVWVNQENMGISAP
jgi:hypothetical protein